MGAILDFRLELVDGTVTLVLMQYMAIIVE